MRSDIDHLTRILFLCGKPDQETIDKIISEEVRARALTGDIIANNAGFYLTNYFLFIPSDALKLMVAN